MTTPVYIHMPQGTTTELANRYHVVPEKCHRCGWSTSYPHGNWHPAAGPDATDPSYCIRQCNDCGAYSSMTQEEVQDVIKKILTERELRKTHRRSDAS